MDPLPSTYSETRAALHRVAAHVLARRRSDLTGKFGLRAAPAGIGIPAAGPEYEVLRTSGARLVRELTGEIASTASIDLFSSTLAEAAAFADVDLGAPLDIGRDSVDQADPNEPLGIDDAAARALGRWLSFAWPVLDEVVASLGTMASPNVIQLWPEHFDAGCDVTIGEHRATIGASTGDQHFPTPYLYLLPWEEVERPGDPGYWNATFGAVLTYDELRVAENALPAALAFLRRGVEALAG